MFSLRATLAVALGTEIAVGQVSSLRGASLSRNQSLGENATNLITHMKEEAKLARVPCPPFSACDASGVCPTCICHLDEAKGRCFMPSAELCICHLKSLGEIDTAMLTAGSQSSLALSTHMTEEAVLSYVVGYEQHQHLNCYTGHGGEALGPNDGLQAGVHNVADCGKAADQHGGACFVYFWKNNQCFLRTECNLAACEPGNQGTESYEFDTFTPGPVGAECLVEHGQGKWIPYSPPGTLACTAEKCDPGYMTTDMACVPINYNKNEHTNCYSGHGGTALGPNDGLQAARDVEGCTDACNNADGCSCFVFFSKYNQCFLRSECELQQCEIGVFGEESYDFDTYIGSSR